MRGCRINATLQLQPRVILMRRQTQECRELGDHDYICVVGGWGCVCLCGGVWGCVGVDRWGCCGGVCVCVCVYVLYMCTIYLYALVPYFIELYVNKMIDR